MAEIEFLLVGDHADATTGKLNMMGAGWTDLWRGAPLDDGPPPMTHFGIAVGILVAWSETNQPHHLQVKIEDEDGNLLGEAIETDLELGRPPGLPQGVDQRAILAINADIQFPKAGGYRVVAELEPESRRVVSFRVHDQTPPTGP